MKRRGFVKNSLAAALATFSVSNATFASDVKDTGDFKKHNLQFMEYNGLSYEVQVVNIHPAHFRYSNPKYFNVKNKNLYSFSFEQGEFAVLLEPMTEGFVKTYLYELVGKEYKQIGDNISLAENSSMSWPTLGVEVNISNYLY